MVNFSTRIPDYDFHSLALLDFCLSFDTSICSIKAFSPLGNSDHIVVSVSIDFPSYSHRLCDHLRDVQWEDIFKLRASAAAREFCQWIQVGIDVYIPH